MSEAALDEHAPPPKVDRPSPLLLLVAPDRAMERQAKVGRVLWLLLFAWVCSLFLGAALAYRVDARTSTMRSLEKRGQLQAMSDRQLADETRKAERISQVGSIAKGVVGPPLELGSRCLAVLGLCWFLRGKIKGSAVAPVAAAALIPGAIARALDGVAVLRHAMVPPDGIDLVPHTLGAILAATGHPLGGPFLKLGEALDLVSLWAAVMLGFGVAAAGQLPRRRALAGTIVAWICYQLLTRVAT